MIIPSFWGTIIISNCSLKQYNVSRDIVVLSTAFFTENCVDDDNLMDISSPREKKDGGIFYLSNGIASWINCPELDYEDIEMEWNDEVDMLIDHGLIFGRDMARIQFDNNKVYTVDNEQKLVDCSWIKTIKDIKPIDKPNHVLLWVDEKEMCKKLFQKGLIC